MRSAFLFVFAVVAATVMVASCSSSGSEFPRNHELGPAPTSAQVSQNPDSAAVFNDADVMFARMMYLNDARAVEMANLVPQRTTNAEITALASQIGTAKSTEMDKLVGLLDDWGQDSPSAAMRNMNMEHMGKVGGMMRRESIADLVSLTGTEFDQKWLAMMIDNRMHAVSMAEKEIADGSNADAKAVAQSIADAGSAEIAQLQALLD